MIETLESALDQILQVLPLVVGRLAPHEGEVDPDGVRLVK
jgi:hypothetical protein